MISIPFTALSPLQLFVLLTYAVTILSILLIWYIQFRDCRRQYALSFFFLWHFVGSVAGVVNLFLVSEATFPLSLFNITSNPPASPVSAMSFTTTSISSTITSPTLIVSPLNAKAFNSTLFSPQPYSSSGLTAILFTNKLPTTIPGIDEYAASMDLCIIFSHLLSVQCLGSCIALARWTWYIYRSLRRKRGVVNPKLINVLQVNQPRGSDTGQNNNGPEFAPGFSFRRPFSSLADIQLRLPACVVTPIVMLFLLLREIWKQLFFCCSPNRVVPYRHGADLDDNELFENWPKYPNQLDESPRVPGSQSSQRSRRVSDAISVANSGSGSLTPPLTTLAAKLGVNQVDLSNPSIEEITYGYDISGMRIKYTQDSWHHHFKQKVQHHRKMLDEVTVCIIWPLVVALVLFFVKMPDRSYELFATRGGCGLPKEGGLADFILVTTIDAISTVFSAMSCLLAVLSCRLFQAQNGSVTLKIKGLTPSPAVIQLLKSTILVRNFLNLSLMLNGLVFISRLVHVVASGIHFQSMTPHTGLPRPLFNIAEHDYAIFAVFVSMAVALLTLLSLTWKRWSRFAKALCRFYAKRGVGSEVGDSDDVSGIPFPFHEMHRMKALEKSPKTDDMYPRGIWAKMMVALRHTRRARNPDELDREERGGDTICAELTYEGTTEQSEKEVTSCPDISREIAPASYLHDFALSVALEAPPKAPSLKIKTSREWTRRYVTAPSTRSCSGSSRYSVSKKRLPSLPKDPASSVLSSGTLNGNSLCPRSAYSHGGPGILEGSEGRDVVRSLSPRPHKLNPGNNARHFRDSIESKASSVDHGASLTFTDTQGRERQPSAGSIAEDVRRSSRQISPWTRCDRHRHHRHRRHQHSGHYRVRHPIQEDASSIHTHRRQHTRECDRASNRSIRYQKHSSRVARLSCAQDEDPSSASESTSSSEYEDEVSAEEFGVTYRNDNGGSRLMANRRMQEVAKHSSISAPEVQLSRHQCSHHRHHRPKHHHASVSASYMSNHSQQTSEDSIAHPRARSRYDDRYGHSSTSQPKSSRHCFSKEQEHRPVWKSSSRKTYAASILTCSAITDNHGQAASPESPLLPPISPLVPPRLCGHGPTTDSSQSSLISTPSSLLTTAANEDSDIEHSATISQRRHMSDSVLATNLKIMNYASVSGERTMYSSELGRMISLPQGIRPPLRSSSSASIASHSTTGTLRGLRFSKEPVDAGSAMGGSSLITSSLSKHSQEQLLHTVMVIGGGGGGGAPMVKKVSSRILNKIYHIIPKEEATRTVQTIAPAPQIRPPAPPGLVKSNVAAQEMVAPVSVLASSVSTTVSTRSFTATSRRSKSKEDKIKVLFFGSDSFSVPHLEALIQEKNRPGSKIERIDVVSPKERTKKSKRDAEDSPLTLLAKAHGLKTFPSPDRKGGFDAWTFPQDPAVPAWDFGVVVSFGWFLPNDVIARFTRAGINVHPSLLPKYRGSAPLQRAILNDDATTGVTVQLLDPNEFDAGKILAQAEVTMPENSTYRSLEALLAKKGGELVVDVVNNFDERRRDAKTQDPEKVTKANKISREACKMQWNTWKASRAERLHRATGFRYPITASWSIPDADKVLSISLFDLFLVPNIADAPSSTGTSKYFKGGYAVEDGDAPTDGSAPGTIFYHRPSESLHVSCADGSLLGVKALQFEGKKRVSAKDFFNGYHVKSGISRFE